MNAQRSPRPARGDVIDAGFTIGLVLIAVTPLSLTYDSLRFLFVTGVGAALGMLVGYGIRAWRWPVIGVAAGVIVVHFLVGPALVDRPATIAGFLPSIDSTVDMATGLVTTWKDVLTTLPPVDERLQFLLLPWVLGLVGGATTMTLAVWTRVSALPVLGPIAVGLTSVLFGTARAPYAALIGALLAAASIWWAALRTKRRAVLASGQHRSVLRTVYAVATLAVAGSVATIVSPHLPGADTPRSVLRASVVPPFDISDYPSPLSAFRKYTKSANLLYDQSILTVTGLPDGTPIRLATLDGYTGLAWVVTNHANGTGDSANTFQKVGTTILSAVDGTPVDLTVTVNGAYSASPELRFWMPTPGPLTAVKCQGPNAAANQEALRYNGATYGAVVTTGLREGDSIALQATIAPQPDATDPQPGAPTGIDPQAYAFVAQYATKWSASESTPYARAMAIAAYLRDNGAYSDGGPGEETFLPGHGRGRIEAMLSANQIVGNDEQYAAAFALLANSVGMPARVVLGAVPGSDGTVKGKDVHAWVEFRLSDGSWLTVPNSEFMPDTSKKPDAVPPQTIEDASAAVVPPPNNVRPPSSLDEQLQDDSRSTRRSQDDSSALPGWISATVLWIAIPAGSILVLCGLIVGAKAFRRHRRRTAGSLGDRVAAGWRQVRDDQREFGAPLPIGATRREQANSVPDFDLTPLASVADRLTFRSASPDESDVTELWSAIDTTRRTNAKRQSVARRVRARLTLATFLPQRRRRVKHQAANELAPVVTPEVAVAT